MTDDERLIATRTTFEHWQHNAHVLGAEGVHFLISEIDKRDAELAALKEHARAHEGHREPCYYCGAPCNGLAGDPGLWPVAMCHPDDPGRVKFHHTRCVFERRHPEGGQMSYWPAPPSHTIPTDKT